MSQHAEEATMDSNNLLYTIAFDVPGSTAYQNLAKMLVISLLKVNTDAEIIVFRNNDSPLFLVERKGVTEVVVDLPSNDLETVVRAARAWKYRARQVLRQTSFINLLYIDADCIVTRNVDDLFLGVDTDIGYVLSTRGPHSGLFQLKSTVATEVLTKWDEIHSTMQDAPEHAAWEQLLSSKEWDATAIKDTMVFCLDAGEHPSFCPEQASILHARGATLENKLRLLFGHYASNYWFDNSLTLVNLFDS